MKYLFFGIVGLCLGLVIGAVSGHLYCIWVYDHATEYEKYNDWWGLADGFYAFCGGLLGAFMGLVTGLVCT